MYSNLAENQSSFPIISAVTDGKGPDGREVRGWFVPFTRSRSDAFYLATSTEHRDLTNQQSQQFNPSFNCPFQVFYWSYLSSMPLFRVVNLLTSGEIH